MENKEEVAKQVGVGAVKFYDLNLIEITVMTLTWTKWFHLKETGPYVQYAHARIQSILRKANRKVDINNISLAVSDAEAWEIVKALKEFPNVVKRAADNYEPSVIAKYAISLAQAFNKYYAHVRILEDDAQLDGRLALISATSIVLKEALRLLGVAAPENM